MGRQRGPLGPIWPFTLAVRLLDSWSNREKAGQGFYGRSGKLSRLKRLVHCRVVSQAAPSFLPGLFRLVRGYELNGHASKAFLFGPQLWPATRVLPAGPEIMNYPVCR